MRKEYYFCDVCKQECLPKDGIATFVGFIVKINDKLEQQRVGFEGHYCKLCSEHILDFITTLNHAENNNTPLVDQ